MLRTFFVGAAAMILTAGLATSAQASASTATSPDNDRVTVAKAPSTSWKSWKCGKSERYRSFGAYQCKRWVKFDYCGSSRPMRLVQKTKMSGLMWTRWYVTPPGMGTDVDQMHKWKKSSTVKSRNMYIGQKGRYFYVQTPKKPKSKPVIRCEHP